MSSSGATVARLDSTRTHANLLEAFARESQANRRYLWFAQRADVDGYPEAAALFRSIAESETAHAHGHLEFLAEVASHGFIVLAIGPYRDSPAPRAQRPADPADWPPFETRYSQMLDALDWIAAENERAASPFFGRIAVDTVAVMGHSCGGLQAVKASVDPRVTTVVVLNSGMMADGDQYMHRHELERSILEEMHAPIAYFIGGESDIAYPNAEQDWQALKKLGLTAINANMDVGHGATYQMPNGGPFARGPLAWLEWQLKGDAQARASFVDDDCGFCSRGGWTLRRHFPR